MSKKPKAVECTVCGEMIEPYWDGYEGMWRMNCITIVATEINGAWEPLSSPKPMHGECSGHERIWNRIRAIEGKLK